MLVELNKLGVAYSLHESREARGLQIAKCQQ